MKCLVVGGGGFLGSHVNQVLLAAGYSVRIFDRPSPHRKQSYPNYEAYEWVEGDLLNQEQVARALSGCDTVLHLAWTTLPGPSNENTIYDAETNIIGSLRLLEGIRQQVIKRLVFVSSGGTVYGVPQHVPISEKHPNSPTCAYGITKLAVEKYCELYWLLHNVDYRILRVANPYGERQRPDAAQGAVAVLAHKALKGHTIDIWGDGEVVRDYVYVSDVAAALIGALETRAEPRIFNIGGGKGRSINDVLLAIEKILGRKTERRYLPARSFDVPRNVLDITLARQNLEWAPRVDFMQGLERTIRWLSALD